MQEKNKKYFGLLWGPHLTEEAGRVARFFCNVTLITQHPFWWLSW